MKPPFISIIIPTLNEEKYIENTLKAIRGQDYKGRYEVIVADAKSNDSTLRIAKKYADKVVSVKKKGIGAGRNAGVRHAKGGILLFLDADTIPSKNLLSSLAATFMNKEIVGATCKILPNTSDKSIKTVYKLFNKFMKLTIKMNKASIAGVCCSYRKGIFKDLGGFNENLSTYEDVDLSLRANKLGKIAMLPHSFVLTSSRRFEKWGVGRSFISYLFNFTKFYLVGRGFSSKYYKPIR